MIDYESNKYKKGIYMVKCNGNGFVYIGATGTQFRYRKTSHLVALKNGKHHKKDMQNDCFKYGIESFEFIILETIDDIDIIKEREKYYIDIYKCNGNCYNVNNGGENIGNVLSDETRKRMSEAHKGIKPSEYSMQVLMEYNKNKVVSKETKEKLSKYFAGEKSNFAKITDEQAKEIKIKLMNGRTKKSLMEEYDVGLACIDFILMDQRWKHIQVDGWEEFQKNRKGKWHKLTEEQEIEIFNRLNNGELRWSIHLEYGISYDKIENIIKKYNK